MTPFARAHRRLRQLVLGRRRLLAAVLTAVAVASALRVVAGPPPPTTLVLTAARDLPSGTVVRASDLTQVPFTPESVPAGVLREHQVTGRTTAAPLRSGEPVTDARLVQGSLLEGYPGTVAAPVRIGDAGAVRLLRVGDRIDLLAADPESAEARVLASDVPVLAIPRDDADSDHGGPTTTGGALIVVALSADRARDVAKSAVSSFITLAIRR